MGNGCFYADRLAAGYGKRPVAEGLSFHAGRGEIVTLIGPNGAGKSTILKTISGGLAPMGGELALPVADPVKGTVPQVGSMDQLQGLIHGSLVLL